MPLGIKQGVAVYPPMATEDELTTAALSADGKHVKSWVRRPEGGVWKPHDLLWLPPTATKSTDIDRAGTIVDVTEGPGDFDWITAQINKREKYLDMIRAKVKAGAYRLTAALAKFLDMPFDEDGAQLVPRSGLGTFAYGKSATAKALYDEGRRLIAKAGYPIDPDTGLPDIGRGSTDEARIKDVVNAATKRLTDSGDVSAAMDEIWRGVERTRPGRV